MAMAANGVAGQVALLVEEGKEAPQDPEPGGACRGGQAVPGSDVEPSIDIFGRGVRKILYDGVPGAIAGFFTVSRISQHVL